MNLGIAFTPLVPEYVVWAGFAAAVLISFLLLLSRGRGALMRAIAMALMVLALANPSLTREDRDPIPSVAAVIVDKSPSQDFGDRNAQTKQALDTLTARLKRIPGLELRVADAGQADGDNDGTRLFSALSATLADVPPGPHRRRHHDHRRPRARRAGQCRSARLCRAGARADHRPRQRDRPPRRAHRDAALRHRRAVADGRLPHRGPGRSGGRRRSDRAPRRRGAGETRGDRAHRHQGEGADPACRAEHRGSRSLSARRRTHPGQQSRGGVDRRRARQAARAAGFRRAACRRAYLAQPVEVRRLGRSGAFHHPAPAGEAGRHADQRIVADRLSRPASCFSRRSTSSSSSSSTAMPARACCRRSISTTSRNMCATAARCWSPPAPITPAPTASGARRSTSSCRPSRAARSPNGRSPRG